MLKLGRKHLEEECLELSDKAKACYCLTGTPLKNGRPINLLPLLQATKHSIAKDIAYYHRDSCNGHQQDLRDGIFRGRPT